MERLGTIERRGDAVDLRYERHYPRPIETVWAALTDPARLADWVSPALVEPRAGGRYELFTERARPMTGRILTWEPPHLLEYSWDTGDAPESVVRCELTTEGDGTTLVFLHKGVIAKWIALVLPGWHSLLERLQGLLAGQPKPDAMERWRELQAVYIDHYKLEGVIIDPPPGHCE
ncbi:MAG TPA: SRPBCC family protein [Aliidongia sp.]|uniref:SRPBCC family protein n=1 Tax=Aliidongia sp. TaxID=1914230 RepID=UPI002DDD0B97|nr:SRPBCC family protein [Aliidongia sp.]HEV2677007.1 SRPBCC family protein [Aliidongia sp.]